MRGAVYAWARTYHPLSGPTIEFPNGSEWGTWIYSDPSLQGRRFMFGEEPSADNRGESWVRPPAQNPEFITLGWIHTHPNPGTGFAVEQFSAADGNFTVRHAVPGFLVAPSGTVRRLSPSWENLGGNIIHNNSPHVSIYIRNE